MGEQAGYSRDICSFHRCIAGAASAGNLPRPAALLASTHLCDGAPLLFQNMAALYGSPLLALDIPYSSGAGGGALRGWAVGADLAQPGRVTGRRPAGTSWRRQCATARYSGRRCSG